MRVPRIYTPSTLTTGTAITLDDHAANHVGRVLRMQKDQTLELFNGDGNDYPATLVHVDKRSVRAQLGQAKANPNESPLDIHLGQVLSRGDRMDYAIQKSVELGVSSITPLMSARCEVRLRGDREDKRQRHWQQVAISAAEQSGRARIPTINPVLDLETWLESIPGGDLKLVLHHRTTRSLSDLPKPAGLALLIGPEGGLNEDEIATAEGTGFLPAALGPRVMRTETAPVAALTVCQWLWGDIG